MSLTSSVLCRHQPPLLPRRVCSDESTCSFCLQSKFKAPLLDVSAVISARTFVIECCDGRSSAAVPTAAELLRRKLAKLVGMHAAVLLL